MLEELLKQRARGPEYVSGIPAMPGARAWEISGTLAGESRPVSGDRRLELLFCRSGALEIHTPRGDAVHLKGREILLLSGPVRVSGGPVQGTLVAVDGLLPEPAAWDLEKALGLAEEQGGCICISGAWNETLFDALERLPSGDRGHYCVRKGAELLYLLCRGALDPSGGCPEGGGTDPIQQAGAYIRAHLGEDLSIRRLTEEFHVSSTALKAGFRRIYGMPVHRYIAGCRMELAAELLTGTSLSVVQIAAEAGYSSVSQFGAMFRQRYGLSPAQYRKQAKNV